MISQYNDTKYKEICSEKTLQSNGDGFFKQFVRNISQNLGDNFIKQFGKLKSDQERIQFVTHHDQARNLVIEVFTNITEVYRVKNEANAELLRVKAQTCLEHGKYSEALHFFNQSILKAPNTSDGLTLAFLGRAKVLENPSLALTDIQTALKLGLGDNLKPKAFLTMAQCYASLGEHKRSQVSLKLAQKLDPSLMPAPINQYDGTAPPTRLDKQIPPPIKNPHEKYACASNQIRVNQSETCGRFVEASRAVKAGDALVVEPAFSACLFPERFGTHCQHCFGRLEAPYACDECSNVAFCGPECKQLAAKSYHKFECKFLELLIGSGMSALGYTALRMVTQNDLEDNMNSFNERDGVYALCTNSGQRDGFDFFQRTLMALFLWGILKKSGYFGDEDNGSVLPTTTLEFTVAEMLLFNLQLLQFNAHVVTEKLYAEERNRFKNTRSLEIGVAVYPTVALFNHDCYPAVTRYFIGKHIVIKATRPLQPGDVIAENYGPIFTRRTLLQRRVALKGRYWFDCQCLACTEDWPVLTTTGLMDDTQERIKCPYCSNFFTLPLRQITIKCRKCKAQVDLSDNLKLLEQCKENYRRADELMAAQKPQEVVQLLCTALDLFHKISAPPHKATHLAEDLLRACYCDFGNSHGGCTYTVKNDNSDNKNQYTQVGT